MTSRSYHVTNKSSPLVLYSNLHEQGLKNFTVRNISNTKWTDPIPSKSMRSQKIFGKKNLYQFHPRWSLYSVKMDTFLVSWDFQ